MNQPKILFLNIILKPLIFIALIISMSSHALAQKTYPTDYFQSPLDIPLILSGSFAELRSNHFHSGIDIKTQGVTGKKVYAVADGYVSRIKVSAWGYGNAIYIRHANGYTSVYGHLDKYNAKISEMVKAKQYANQSFEIELFPKPGELPIIKGEIIAFSGNSGGSGGPHLHFEIRDSRTEEPVNPLHFGYQIADHQYPKIKKFRIYNYQNSQILASKDYDILQTNGQVKLRNNVVIQIPTREFYAAVMGYDQLDGASNHNGYYRLQYYLDDSLFFQFSADKINFSHQRYINTYIDFEEYYKTSDRFQRTFVEKNDKLGSIREAENHGIIQLKDSEIHQLKVVASDFAGQSSVLLVDVQKHEKAILSEQIDPLFKWDRKNTYNSNEMEFEIPEGALYSDQNFWMETLKNPYSKYSQLFSIYDESVAINQYCKIKLKVNDSIVKGKQHSQLCILSLDKKNRAVYEGGKYVNGWIESRTRSFGKYYIGIDSLSPVITPINIYSGKNISQQSDIKFTVTDNLSGVDKYKASLDGNWILLEYDAKNNRLTYTIDEHFPKGKHEFVIQIWDDRGNKTSNKYPLIRN